jgi:glutaredoxin 3
MSYVFCNHVFHVSLFGILAIAIAQICSHFRLILGLLVIGSGCQYFNQQEQVTKQECTMLKIEVYSKEVCPYCVRAKKLLTKKGVTFTEIDVAQDPELRDAMIKRANGKQTVPQIFINDKHIGGCDDLYALDAAGKLDDLLKDDCHV